MPTHFSFINARDVLRESNDKGSPSKPSPQKKKLPFSTQPARNSVFGAARSSLKSPTSSGGKPKHIGFAPPAPPGYISWGVKEGSESSKEATTWEDIWNTTPTPFQAYEQPTKTKKHARKRRQSDITSTTASSTSVVSIGHRARYRGQLHNKHTASTARKFLDRKNGQESGKQVGNSPHSALRELKHAGAAMHYSHGPAWNTENVYKTIPHRFDDLNLLEQTDFMELYKHNTAQKYVDQAKQLTERKIRQRKARHERIKWEIDRLELQRQWEQDVETMLDKKAEEGSLGKHRVLKKHGTVVGGVLMGGNMDESTLNIQSPTSVKHKSDTIAANASMRWTQNRRGSITPPGSPTGNHQPNISSTITFNYNVRSSGLTHNESSGTSAVGSIQSLNGLETSSLPPTSVSKKGESSHGSPCSTPGTSPTHKKTPKRGFTFSSRVDLANAWKYQSIPNSTLKLILCAEFEHREDMRAREEIHKCRIRKVLWVALCGEHRSAIEEGLMYTHDQLSQKREYNNRMRLLRDRRIFRRRWEEDEQCQMRMIDTWVPPPQPVVYIAQDQLDMPPDESLLAKKELQEKTEALLAFSSTIFSQGSPGTKLTGENIFPVSPAVVVPAFPGSSSTGSLPNIPWSTSTQSSWTATGSHDSNLTSPPGSRHVARASSASSLRVKGEMGQITFNSTFTSQLGTTKPSTSNLNSNNTVNTTPSPANGRPPISPNTTAVDQLQSVGSAPPLAPHMQTEGSNLLPFGSMGLANFTSPVGTIAIPGSNSVQTESETTSIPENFTFSTMGTQQ